jgi:heme exporter protein B
MNMLAAIVRFELLLAWRRKSALATTLGFFVIVASLFPLALGADPKLLRLIGAGVVWVAALLATLLGLARLFAADHEDGTLEQLRLAPLPLPLAVMAKLGAHWLLTAVPLCLAAPILGLQYGLSAGAIGVLVVGLLLGTPVLCLMGAVGAALTLGLRASGVLVPVIVLPLEVPVLIMGAGAVEAHASGLGAGPWLSLLAALFIVFLLAAPLVIAFALRISSE